MFSFFEVWSHRFNGKFKVNLCNTQPQILNLVFETLLERKALYIKLKLVSIKLSNVVVVPVFHIHIYNSLCSYSLGLAPADKR